MNHRNVNALKSQRNLFALTYFKKINLLLDKNFWWKNAGSQYGLLKNWRVSAEGTFIDGTKISDVTLANLNIRAHTSVKVRIGIKEGATNIGGVNIFGKGFGNYDQDMVMRMYVA